MLDLVKVGIGLGLAWMALAWVFAAPFILASRISREEEERMGRLE